MAEILIAVVMAGIIIGGVTSTIGASLIASKKIKQITTATALAQQDLEAARTIGESNWFNIYCPPSGSCPGGKGASVNYRIVLLDGSWQIQSGVATTSIDSIVYTHYFHVENISRDTEGLIIPYDDQNSDPSAQKITEVISWPNGDTDFIMSEYLMRTTSAYFKDFNWTSGNIGSGPYTSSGGAYAATSDSVIIIENWMITTEVSITSGYLESSTFDVGSGATFNIILWNGQLNGGHVRFTFASSKCPNGGLADYPTCAGESLWGNSAGGGAPFLGSDGTETGYYEAGPTKAIPLRAADHNQRQYFRYRVYLTAGSSDTPNVSSVIIGYSP